MREGKRDNDIIIISKNCKSIVKNKMRKRIPREESVLIGSCYIK